MKIDYTSINRRLSTLESSGNTLKSLNNETLNLSENMKNSYLNLISKVVEFLRLKDSQSKTIVLSLEVEDLNDIDNQDVTPFEVKKFCTDVRVAANSKFGRNFLEILLLPISKNVAVEEKALHLTSENDNNFALYKDLVQNDILRGAIMQYIDQVPHLEKMTLTIRTTLKSFQKNEKITKLVENVKEERLTQEDRYFLVGLFLSSLLFEIIDCPRGKRSKSRIINFIIDLFSKSGT